MSTLNRQWIVRRHVGATEAVCDTHFELTESPLPSISEGEVLVKTLALGTSPAQRGYIDVRKGEPVPVGAVMRGRGIGRVEQSKHPDFSVGDWVNASTGWQEWSVQRAGLGEVQSMDVLRVAKVDASVRPSTLHLGVLGSAAFTALYGLEEIGQVMPGDTVVVSAAAGGVGSMACQIASALGANVVGIAGGASKCEWVIDTLGAESAIDYRTGDISAALDRHCPNGVDVFFDNVGGPILNAVLSRLAVGARVAVCGYIATDYAENPGSGPTNYIYLLRQRARMEGFVIWDQPHRYPDYYERLKRWLAAGVITRDAEDVKHGIEEMPGALQSLFTGGNMGIRLVQVSPDDQG